MTKTKLCAVDGCDKEARQKGWCYAHYGRWYRNGSPHVMRRATPNPHPPKTCIIEGCGKPHNSHGYCTAHYNRLRRHGDAAIATRAANGECLKWINDHKGYDEDDCLAWPYASGRRGDAVVLHDGRMRSASRVMCEEVHGPAPDERYECAHSCGNGHLGCMNPRHLRWDTRSGNHADKVIHGTDNRGEKHPLAKLSTEQVKRILHGGEGAATLSVDLGVSRTTVWAIRRGIIWRHLSGPIDEGGRG